MLPRILTELPGPRSRKLTAKSNELEPPCLTGGDQNPNRVFWAIGRGANIEDVDGNVFLDMTSAFGVSLAGHGAAHVGDALCGQAHRLLHSMGDLFPSASKLRLGEAILRALSLPAADWKVAFGTSGSDVVELALKLAHKHTGRSRFLAFGDGYHGQALGALPVMGHSMLRRPFEELFAPLVEFIAFPEQGTAGASASLPVIEARLRDGQFAAIVIEPIQGLSGYRFMDSEVASAIKSLATRYGTLIIADEIFSGFWRAGHALFSNRLGLEADIVCVGKALGGGVPIGAIIARTELWNGLQNKHGPLPLHGGTFGGDPLCCEGALANLDWFEQTKIWERIRTIERPLGDALKRLAEEMKQFLAIRGEGLLWAIEIDSKISNSSALVLRIVKRCLDCGVLYVQTGFPRGNVLGIAPPAVLALDELNFAVETLASAMREELRL